MIKSSKIGAEERLRIKRRKIWKKWYSRNKTKCAKRSCEYKKLHKEEIREKYKQYCLLNRDKILRQKAVYRRQHKQEIHAYSIAHKNDRRQWYQLQRDTLIGRLKLRINKCKKRKFECTITLEDILKIWGNQGGKCALTGTQMTYTNGLESISIDRINNELGYIPANVRLVCWWANRAKNSFSDEEFYNFCQSVLDCP